MKIALIGPTSSGKTSFVNALACKYMEYVSVLKTHIYTQYIFDMYDIIECCDINRITEAVEDRDIIIYMFDYYNADRQFYNNTMQILHELNILDVLIVANKYDELDEHDEYDDWDMLKTCFKISSHNLLIERLISNGATIDIPDDYKNEFTKIVTNAGLIYTEDFSNVKQCEYIYGGDWDDLLSHITYTDDNNNVNAVKTLLAVPQWVKSEIENVTLQKIYDIYQLCTDDDKYKIATMVNEFIIDIFAPGRILISFYIITGMVCKLSSINIQYYLYIAIDCKDKERVYELLRNELYITIFRNLRKIYKYYDPIICSMCEFSAVNAWDWLTYLIKLAKASPDQLRSKIISSDEFLPYIKSEYCNEILFNITYGYPILDFKKYNIGNL